MMIRVSGQGATGAAPQHNTTDTPALSNTHSFGHHSTQQPAPSCRQQEGVSRLSHAEWGLHPGWLFQHPQSVDIAAGCGIARIGALTSAIDGTGGLISCALRAPNGILPPMHRLPYACRQHRSPPAWPPCHRAFLLSHLHPAPSWRRHACGAAAATAFRRSFDHWRQRDGHLSGGCLHARQSQQGPYASATMGSCTSSHPSLPTATTSQSITGKSYGVTGKTSHAKTAGATMACTTPSLPAQC